MADQLPPGPKTTVPIKSRERQTLRLLVALQTDDNQTIEAAEVQLGYYHNGYAYVVTYPGLPPAQHFSLSCAAMDLFRIALLENPDFMRWHRPQPPPPKPPRPDQQPPPLLLDDKNGQNTD